MHDTSTDTHLKQHEFYTGNQGKIARFRRHDVQRGELPSGGAADGWWLGGYCNASMQQIEVDALKKMTEFKLRKMTEFCMRSCNKDLRVMKQSAADVAEAARATSVETNAMYPVA